MTTRSKNLRPNIWCRRPSHPKVKNEQHKICYYIKTGEILHLGAAINSRLASRFCNSRLSHYFTFVCKSDFYKSLSSIASLGVLSKFLQRDVLLSLG